MCPTDATGSMPSSHGFAPHHESARCKIGRRETFSHLQAAKDIVAHHTSRMAACQVQLSLSFPLGTPPLTAAGTLALLAPTCPHALSALPAAFLFAVRKCRTPGPTLA